MTDIVDPATRSRMMAGIRGRDTKPELLIRSGLHRMGFRFRLHGKGLPGKPDMVFTSRSAVIEVRGCFWHGHDCPLFRWPATRPEFWREKIAANIARDARNRKALLKQGWRMAEVWECQIKGPRRTPVDGVLAELVDFLNSPTPFLSVGGSRTITVHQTP
ncbi:very short patch repair endonuclease [Sphingopyxis sp. P8]|uniref:very short patch repair endonuclease n=1 Tax=Sphingopyxis sp. P8 TaxID=2763256 RepID=UPI001D0B06D9|nr:very short patch repair endonuclease [Sphingopyxis sp. P8]